MDLRKIDVFNGLTGKQFNSEPGRHAGLMVMAEGTNDTGQTGTVEDIGSFVITRNGKQRINRNAKKFVDINDIRQGTNVFSSTEAGDFQASLFIPFFEKGLPNAWNITDEKELNIRHVPGPNTSTVFSDLEITVQSQLSAISEKYNYNILGEDQDFASAVGSKPIKFNQDNVTTIYVEDVDDVVQDLQFESNGKIIVSNNDMLALQAYTNYNNRIEDNTFDVVEIENYTQGVPGSTASQNNIMRMSSSGAGNVDITVCSIDWGKGN